MSSPPEDRLSEAKSAYTVRGGDAPDIDAGIAAMRTEQGEGVRMTGLGKRIERGAGH